MPLAALHNTDMMPDMMPDVSLFIFIILTFIHPHNVFYKMYVHKLLLEPLYSHLVSPECNLDHLNVHRLFHEHNDL